MSALRVIAPAKINWTLEVLRVRPDGYHELRSVLQTIDLHDVITLEDADEITLEVSANASLSDDEPERNLAFRAAVAFRARAGLRRGARIVLEKRIPVAAGLGGGSSDAAAVLRGLNALWDAGQPELNLVEVAAEIGSDPPFFISAGTAAAGGRGEQITVLPDAVAPPLLLAVPPPSERGEKTASMFAALKPQHYSDGEATIGVREAAEAGEPLVDGMLANVFEQVVATMQPDTATAIASLRAQGYAPHLAGSGPSLFLMAPEDDGGDLLAERIEQLGFEARFARPLARADALRIERF